MVATEAIVFINFDSRAINGEGAPLKSEEAALASKQLVDTDDRYAEGCPAKPPPHFVFHGAVDLLHQQRRQGQHMDVMVDGVHVTEEGEQEYEKHQQNEEEELATRNSIEVRFLVIIEQEP